MAGAVCSASKVFRHAQDAMRAAEKKSTEDCPVKMKLVAPPLYVLTTNVSNTSFSSFIRHVQSYCRSE